MGIRKLGWDNWIEMDSYFLRYHDMKAAELKKEFNEHVKYVDNAATRDACFELNEELVRYLVHRYPKIYRLEGDKVHNSLTGEKFAFPAGRLNPFSPLNCISHIYSASPEEALATSALLVQDDLVIMMKNDGEHINLVLLDSILILARWSLSPRCGCGLSAWILASEREIPHVARYITFRSRRTSLCNKIAESYEQVLSKVNPRQARREE